MRFIETNYLYFDLNANETAPMVLIDNEQVLIQVMVWPNRRQAIAWPKDDIIHWRIYVSPDLKF